MLEVLLRLYRELTTFTKFPFARLFVNVAFRRRWAAPVW